MSDTRNPTILLTRPAAQSEKDAKTLNAMGYNTILSPVLVFEPLSFTLPTPAHYSGLIFTSLNGVKAFQACCKNHLRDYFDLSIFCLGEKTATYLKQLGFRSVHFTTGTARDLKDFIYTQKLTAHGRPLLYLCAQDIAFAMDEALIEQTIPAQRQVIYRMMPAENFSPEALKALQENVIDSVMLYSQRSANAFAVLIERYGLEDHLNQIRLLSISQAVLGCVRALPFARTQVAKSPDQAGIFSLLDQ